LELTRCRSLTNKGLKNILDKCPNLKSLKISEAFLKDKNLIQKYNGRLGKRKIEALRKELKKILSQRQK